jgi:hypothetical protein
VRRRYEVKRYQPGNGWGPRCLRANLPSSYPYQRRGNSYDLFGSGKKGSDVDMKAWSSLGNRDDRDLI